MSRDGKSLTDSSLPSFLIPLVFIEIVEHTRDIDLEVLNGGAFLWREILEPDPHVFVRRRKILDEKTKERRDSKAGDKESLFRNDRSKSDYQLSRASGRTAGRFRIWNTET